MSTPPPRGLAPKPPEKGVFPLDHFGECKEIKDRYLKCLSEHHADAEACRQLTKEYLQCRMERNLMAKQDLKDLGFSEGEGPAAKLQPAEQQVQQRAAEAAAAAAAAAAESKDAGSDRPAAAREGFVAGTLRFRKPGT